ncbi:DUF4179 domain-containing protein [Paenibacillus sp. NPDC058071]|uniref:DUF4179 domain-containing protein n=1 Tax=Paenibacillus sp. NPDC058071 TaxID=3346326 RepID=UPI0036DCBD2C
MNAMSEEQQKRYIELLDAVPIPPLPSDAELIAHNRLRRKKIRRRRWLQSAILAAVAFIAFIGSIQVSPAFASAVAQIPGLKPLVEMIAFDRGIEDIINNEYYEYINASQTINGKTLTVTGVVADESGMIISYKIDSDEDLSVVTGVRTELTQGNEPMQAAVGSGWGALEKGTYETENTLDVAASPGMDYSSKEFKLQLSLNGFPETVFEIPFKLTHEIKASKRYPVNKEITVDGQRFTIHELVISPLRCELKMSIDPANTKKILNFEDIRIFDEHQVELGKIQNGIIGFGTYEDEQFSLMLESNYFRIPKSVTIEFREIEAIDKADAFIVVDFDKKTVISQPDAIKIELEIKDNYEVQYKFRPYKQNQHRAMLGKLIDAEGETYHSYSTRTSSYEDETVMGELYDVNRAKKPPTNPVKLEITHYEQYLSGIGRVQVELK